MKKIYFWTFVISLTFCGAFSAYAIDANLLYYFTHVDNRHGLSENNVKSIAQDPWGFIWLGTKNGLNRFDGRSIKQYDVDDYVSGKGNHNVSALFCDSDSILWVGTDKGVFCFDPLTETFKSFDVSTSDGITIGNWISQITCDNEGCIWIVSPQEGVFAYHKKNKNLRFYSPRQKTDDASYNPQCMLIRPDGKIWIGTSGQGIFLLDRQSGNVRQTVTDQNGNSIRGENIYTMANYGDWILLGEHEGQVVKYHTKQRLFQPLESQGVHYKVIRAFNVKGDDIFVGTQNGLYIINEKKHEESHLYNNSLIPSCLSDNMVYSLFRDRDDGLWVGTMKSGLDYMPSKGLHFYTYVTTGNSYSLSSSHIREMQRAPDGNIWISTEGGDINIFKPEVHEFETLNAPIYKGGCNRLALMLDGQKMWSGLFKNGLDIIDVTTRQISHYSPAELGLTIEGSVYALLKDSKGRIWLGTGNGIYLKKEDRVWFEKVKEVPNVFTQDIVEDRSGKLWIASIGSGIYAYDPATGKSVNYRYNSSEKEASALSSNDISSITMDHQGNLWFATDRGGLCMYDFKSKQFVKYGKKDGLMDDVTYKVLEDKGHRLWFGTNHGLVCFDRKEKNFKVYHNTEALPGNQFNYKSAVIGSDGLFYFGGSAGLIAFNPMLDDSRRGAGKVYVTHLRVNREEVKPSADMLQTNIIEAKEIRLPYDFANLSMAVSSLNYSGTENDSYEYMLSGVDDTWVFSPDGQDIYYSKLQPGEYLFHVRQAGTKSGETVLRIIVSHPWWSTIPMRIVYGILFLLGVLGFFKMIQWRQASQMKIREERFKEEHDKELLKSKINFFTDITHEIRTPLTLINGSVENIREENVDNVVVAKNIRAIDKNTRRLLNLTNQLLDFRKVDSNMVKLLFTNVPFSELLSSVVSRFEPTINHAYKNISLDMPSDNIVIQGDSEAITKIISNLLNNALKYSESFIEVSVHENEDTVELHVENDGPKIPESKAEEIFKPFFQLDSSHAQPGSGLGLPMARSLAELHGGTLRVNPASQCNEFVLVLPKRQEHVINMTATVDAENVSNTIDAITDDYLVENFSQEKNKRQNILVVEDNVEVLQMICDGMAKHYNVITAQNGEEGLAKTHQHRVDLIITDLMMPVMDGVEMTRRLKEDIETSHIPVVMLTAKQTLDNRIEGLRAGADAYIEKPFSFSHLFTQVETLLTNRKRERESFAKRPYLSVETSGINRVEEEFISQITDLIMKNIQKPDFNVEQLAAEMCMSRSSLNRKIKVVSDMTPIDFIRLIRLKKAAELIREHGYNINEVCEMVGISSPSYFIKLFQRQFGMTPKEFAMQKK